jgi:hypothetical protein
MVVYNFSYLGKAAFVGAALLMTLSLEVASAADVAKPRGQDKIEVQTGNGAVKGKIIRPESSKEKPGDIGRRAHTPLEIFVPDRPIKPPRNF